MSPPDLQNVTFEVTAADAAAELFLIDGRFRLVDRGIGHGSFSVPPGVYKLKQRSGNATSEQHVVVRAGMPQPELPDLEFASPIPLARTSRTPAAHMSAAASASRRVDVEAGAGSSVLLMVRAWTRPDAGPDSWTADDRWRSLTLRTWNGTPVADFQAHALQDLTGNPWATCRIALAPGLYRLRFDRRDGAAIEQTVAACAGWDTQVYMVLEPRTADRGPIVDLVNTAVTMVPGGTVFDPDDPALRMEELARLALLDDRKILSSEVRARIVNPEASPMLALLGAHLLIREARRAKLAADEDGRKTDIDNTAPVRTIVETLRRRLGDHPDVEAIAIRAGVPNPRYSFAAPPMLRDSWVLLLRASVDDPSRIPSDSFCARVSERVWGHGPWLLWTDPADERGGTRKAWHAAATELLRSVTDLRAATAPPPTSEIASTRAMPSSTRDAGGGLLTHVVNSMMALAGDVLPESWLPRTRRRSRRPFPDFKNLVMPTKERAPVVGGSRLRNALEDLNTRKAMVGRLGLPLSVINAWLDTLDQ